MVSLVAHSHLLSVRRLSSLYVIVLCLLIASVHVLIASDLLHLMFGIPNLCYIFAGAIRGTLASPIA